MFATNVVATAKPKAREVTSDAALVRADVIEQLVSRRRAEEAYGVVLRDDLTLDEAATTRKRNELRSAAKREEADGSHRHR